MVIDGVELRARIFEQLLVMQQASAGFLSREQLKSFTIDGIRLPLIAPQQGINNPTALEATLSVMSSPEGPYVDGSPVDGIWEYAYEGNTPGRTNAKLRRAHELGYPIVYLERIGTGIYVPYFPVVVIGDRPADLRFDMALDKLAALGPSEADTGLEREYREAIIQQRLHQPKFRARVLAAYATQCTICHFRHAELLDAAHIISDKEEMGVAWVPNGMAMCKIHHAAYDRNFMGITPDYGIQINEELLNEVDGPMLQHGLKDMHGGKLILPKRTVDQPDRERLAIRFAEFQNA